MNEVLKDTEIVVFDIMGVILSNPSLVKQGLYPLYKDRYSYDYVKDLYQKIRSNPDGDSFLWDGLKEVDHKSAREKFLDSYEVEEGFFTFKEYLEKEGFRMGILSNMPKSWGMYFCKKFNLGDEFNPKLFSGNIGVSKPDYGKYVELVKRTGTVPSKILFIDDKLENLEGASTFGIKTVLFKRGIEDGSFTPDLTVESFDELM